MPTDTFRPRRPLAQAAVSVLLLAAASCTPPPTTASVSIPALPPQQGRIWFYREVDTADVNTTTPYVRLNGAIAGVPDPGGAFYRDVPPGTYRITVDSEGNSPRPTQEVALIAGQQIYARIGLGGSWNGQGFTITMEPSAVGHAAVERSKFYGS
jgi:uncharacterized protein (DUF2141 family)